MELTNSLFREDQNLWNGGDLGMGPDLQVCFLLCFCVASELSFTGVGNTIMLRTSVWLKCEASDWLIGENSYKDYKCFAVLPCTFMHCSSYGILLSVFCMASSLF